MIGMLELTTLVTTLVTLLTLPYFLVVVKYFILKYLILKYYIPILLSILLKVPYLPYPCSSPKSKGKDKVQAKRWGLVRF